MISMDISAVQKFAETSAPETAELLIRPVSIYRTYIAMVISLYHEVIDIVQNGDSQLKDIPLTIEDAMPMFCAYRYLQELRQGKQHKDFDGSTIHALPAAIQKVQDAYHIPKVAIAKERLEQAEIEYDALEARYHHLVEAAKTNDAALKALHDEFYPNGVWNPESEDPIEEREDGLTSINHEHQQRAFLDIFKRTYRTDFVHNQCFSVRTMMGVPDSLQDLEEEMGSLRRTIKRNETVSCALSEMILEVKALINPPTAQIYKFPAQQTCQAT